MDAISAFIVAASHAFWIYPLLFVACVIDGFFPPIPSESIVIALASLAITTGQPGLLPVALVAALGAIAGDNIAFLLGRRLRFRQYRWARRPRVARVIDRASSGLARRPASVLLTARFIPVGRVAVNMSAGAIGMRHRAFFPLSVVAGMIWAAYSLAIGVLAGHWAADNPLVGVVIGIVGSTVIGFVIDVLSQRRRRKRGAYGAEFGEGFAQEASAASISVVRASGTVLGE